MNGTAEEMREELDAIDAQLNTYAPDMVPISPNAKLTAVLNRLIVERDKWKRRAMRAEDR